MRKLVENSFIQAYWTGPSRPLKLDSLPRKKLHANRKVRQIRVLSYMDIP